MTDSYSSIKITEKIQDGRFIGHYSSTQWKQGDRQMQFENFYYTDAKVLTGATVFESSDGSYVVKVYFGGNIHYIPLESWESKENFSLENGMVFVRTDQGWGLSQSDGSIELVKSSTDSRFYSSHIVETREGGQFKGMERIQEWKHGDKTMKITRDLYTSPRGEKEKIVEKRKDGFTDDQVKEIMKLVAASVAKEISKGM